VIPGCGHTTASRFGRERKTSASYRRSAQAHRPVPGSTKHLAKGGGQFRPWAGRRRAGVTNGAVSDGTTTMALYSSHWPAGF